MSELHEEISDLLAEPPEDRFSSATEARKRAMDFLARREYGRAELTGKLVSKGFDPEVVEHFLQWDLEALLQELCQPAKTVFPIQIGQEEAV